MSTGLLRNIFKTIEGPSALHSKQSRNIYNINSVDKNKLSCCIFAPTHTKVSLETSPHYSNSNCRVVRRRRWIVQVQLHDMGISPIAVHWLSITVIRTHYFFWNGGRNHSRGLFKQIGFPSPLPSCIVFWVVSDDTQAKVVSVIENYLKFHRKELHVTVKISLG